MKKKLCLMLAMLLVAGMIIPSNAVSYTHLTLPTISAV